jgi:putative mycofactocin binding protein MftB
VTELDPNDAWTLSSSIGLRPEPFGALAYHFETRRLVFLKTNDLVDLVRSLADHPTVDAALDATGLEGRRRTSHLTALASLADAGVIEPRSPVPAEATP